MRHRLLKRAVRSFVVESMRDNEEPLTIEEFAQRWKGRVVGVDREWYSRPVHVIELDKPDRHGVNYIAVVPARAGLGMRWEVLNYTGKLAQPKRRDTSAELRSSFTLAWDEYFYDIAPELEGEPQVELTRALDRHMGIAGWHRVGTVASVGRASLQVGDAIADPASNEFYQFVTAPGEVETLGGRARTRISKHSVSDNCAVWRSSRKATDEDRLHQ